MAIGYKASEVSTSETSRKQRADMWVEHCRDVQGELALRFPGAETLEATTKWQRDEDAGVVEFESTALEYDRRARHVARDGLEGIRLVAPLQGNLGLTQNRDSADIAPGSVGAFNMRYPMKLEHGSGIRALILSIPDNGKTRSLADKVPVFLSGERARVAMLASHMAQMAALYDNIKADEFSDGMDFLVRMLERVVFSEQPADSQAIYDLVWQFVVKHSDRADLDPAGIAAEVGYSGRQLYKVLEAKGTTPWKLLTETRLERAMDRIRDPGRTMRQIAFESGFGSTDSFRRNFFDHFGVTPSQMREKLSSESVAAKDGPTLPAWR